MDEVETQPPLPAEPGGMPIPAPTLPRETRVVKKLAPGQAGARKLARTYGSALVCVRFRQDLAGRMRYTTVELLVASQPVRNVPDAIVGVRIDRDETGVEKEARAHGGEWDRERQVWRISRRTAVQLGWMGRIVATR